MPNVGEIELAKLTTKRIRDWHHGLASAPKLRRTGKTASKLSTAPFDKRDPDAIRARRATANRLLTVLKAALNHAFHEGKVASDDPWRKVKPFREVDSPLVRYLSAAKCLRLCKACEPSFRALVQGSLLTGCRYGELTRLCVADFNQNSGRITVRHSKAGKPRHIALNAEGVQLFDALTSGRGPRDLIFEREDGNAWGKSHQQRPLEEASRQARLDPPATFHILRHSYASALAMQGVPMGVIAAQLGHADTRMTERHYATSLPHTWLIPSEGPASSGIAAGTKRLRAR